MSTTELAWLSIAAALAIMVIGVLWQNTHARRLSRREGNLDRPKLSTWLKRLPAANAGAWSITYVLANPPTGRVTGFLEAMVRNEGKRAAESVVVEILYPRPVSVPDSEYTYLRRGLAPGSEFQRETIGEFVRSSSYWPHIAPGQTVVLRDEFNMESTTVPFAVDARTSDGVDVTVKGVATLAWRANIQLSSKEGVWPGSSVAVRVAVGAPLAEVAKAHSVENDSLERKLCGLDNARGPRRLVGLIRYRWVRGRRRTTQFFVVPHLEPIRGDDGAVWLHREVPEKADWYALMLLGGRWALVPAAETTMTKDADSGTWI